MYSQRRIPFLIGLVFLVSLMSCQKKEDLDKFGLGKQGTDGATPVDISLHCDENFVASWCGTNRENSNVTEVCSGSLVVQDQLIPAISIATSEASESTNRCFVFSGQQEEVSFAGCAQALKNHYAGDLDGNAMIEAIVCYSQNLPAYIEGQSPEGQNFSVFHIE